ncbi:adenine phosphoribosyltransferase [Wenzhouxiangella sp. XN79A]|uniref:adenine phosphoribosyltransferase n=1 Tax=Wenzhouxiangella sp. XN79A TaxID=2724193 RepID=UPI00144A6202|nr:adenine phosphoribosyltransferase [Wenzhouxiangella sp. XN79A]NKI36237.1 adenine phosphoribosyltransferase [Wenzhouxiangella sp. XN79A]
MTDFISLIRDVPDWPEPGIVFKDITPLLAHPEGLAWAVDRLYEPFVGHHIDQVVGIESRGFIFGTAVARALGAGFIPVRKPGKLPRATLRRDYTLEYGSDAVEMHSDAVRPGDRVLLVDDVLATGGTMAASCELVNDAGGELIGCAVLIRLSALDGVERVPVAVHTVLDA